MNIDLNQFWSLLADSKLVPASQVQSFFADFSENSTIPKSPEGLSQWLVEKKAISVYQTKVLLSGQSGPFHYGSYTILDRIISGPLVNNFLARHSQSGYPVLLQFSLGTVSEDLTSWNKCESVIDQLIPIEHANLSETYESVVLPNHRFVVSQFPRGSTLAEKLPSKARLSWKKACSLIAQASRGLAQLHKDDLVHGGISLDKIWLEKNNPTQLRYNPLDVVDVESKAAADRIAHLDYLAPESIGNRPVVTASSDIYSMGCLLTRIISGRAPFPNEKMDDTTKRKKRTQSAPDLSKYDLPADLQSLIQKMTAPVPDDRPQSASEISNLLGLYSGDSEKINAATIPVSKTRIAYRKSLSQFVAAKNSLSESSFPIVVDEAEPDPAIHVTPTNSDRTPPSIEDYKAASEKARQRRKNLWIIPLAISVPLFVVVASVSVWLLQRDANNTNQQSNDGTTQLIPIDGDPEDRPLKKGSADSRPTGPQSFIVQDLIDDDRNSLWETPTSGAPIEFSFLPPSPKMLFSFRLSDLIAQPDGERLIKSMGPEFGSQIERFVTSSGIDLNEIEQLIVSFHSNDQFQYDPFYIVRTKTPIENLRMIQRWNRPVRRQLDNGQEIYESREGDLAFYILHSDAGQADDQENDDSVVEPISMFAMGQTSLVQQVADNTGGSALSGSLRKMAHWTDRDRHVNLLFLRNALFNDEGQHWMGKRLGNLNREMSIFLPDAVRGGLVSFHVDNGNYFEIMLDKNVDLKANDLRQIMDEGFRNRREQLTQFVAGIPSSPYWDKVRLRYDNMLSDVSRNLRWDVERGEVVANCWLPPMAAHNLIAASELVISFSAGATQTTEVIEESPATFEDLLASKRDLNIANPPDLNVLLSDLENEINDDFRKLPFEFHIRLIGADLQLEGITKNQRPSEVVINQKSLADILTAIMIGANPSKDITGPEDPNCKLIWVIADDPEIPGEKAILVTTRAAAVNKSYVLPPAFRTE